jgi:2-pyrone-4,6-dicarboxylate lactonase
MDLPTYKMPKHACDAHCHVMGPESKFPFDPNGPYKPADSPKEALAAMHQRMGIERAVIVHPSAHGTDHAVTLDAIASNPSNLRGVGILDASFTKQQVEELHAGGFRGARFSFLKHLGGGPDDVTLRKVVDLIEPMGWHLVIHVTGDDLLAKRDTFAALTLPIVFDHMARVDAALGVDQPAMDCLLDFAVRPNCWIKVSGASRIAPPPFDLAIPIAQAILAASPDRTLWGTDFPHPNPKYHATEAELVDLVPRFCPDPAQQERLLVQNPARLYGF